jgi:DNA-directed RNA polymerase III subunit RPC4
MPPKASGRGRGGTRARASGRGGGNAGRPTAGAREATEQAAATEAPAQPVVLKHDDDEEDSKPPTPAENTPAPAVQPQPASLDASYVPIVLYPKSTC